MRGAASAAPWTWEGLSGLCPKDTGLRSLPRSRGRGFSAASKGHRGSLRCPPWQDTGLGRTQGQPPRSVQSGPTEVWGFLHWPSSPFCSRHTTATALPQEQRVASRCVSMDQRASRKPHRDAQESPAAGQVSRDDPSWTSCPVRGAWAALLLEATFHPR